MVSTIPILVKPYTEIVDTVDAFDRSTATLNLKITNAVKTSTGTKNYTFCLTDMEGNFVV